MTNYVYTPLDTAEIGWRDGQPPHFSTPSKRNPTPLDGAYGALHRFGHAQRAVRQHLDVGGADRKAAVASLDMQTHAVIDAATAAGVFSDYLRALSARLEEEVRAADARVEAGEDPRTVLAGLGVTVSGLARDVGA